MGFPALFQRHHTIDHGLEFSLAQESKDLLEAGEAAHRAAENRELFGKEHGQIRLSLEPRRCAAGDDAPVEGGTFDALLPGGVANMLKHNVGTLLAGASTDKGAGVFKKCAACHTVEDGAGNKVGPALYGIVDRPIATVDGFSYSSALKAYAEGKTWNYEELNGFLFKPKAHVKGTSMGFGGIKKTQDRADIIAYLRSLAASPAPLPAE